MFFEHHVRVRSESVFRRINEYFKAVETNERGSLHIYGLVWLYGIIGLASTLYDVSMEERESYR